MSLCSPGLSEKQTPGWDRMWRDLPREVPGGAGGGGGPSAGPTQARGAAAVGTECPGLQGLTRVHQGCQQAQDQGWLCWRLGPPGRLAGTLLRPPCLGAAPGQHSRTRVQGAAAGCWSDVLPVAGARWVCPVTHSPCAFFREKHTHCH